MTKDQAGRVASGGVALEGLMSWPSTEASEWFDLADAYTALVYHKSFLSDVDYTQVRL